MANESMGKEKTDRSDATGLVKRNDSRANIYGEIRAASHPVVPSNAILTYMNEGAANIVYTIGVSSSYEDPGSSFRNAFVETERKREDWGFWDGKLLRLRKELPWTAPCAVAQADFLLDIYPLFDSEHLVEQHLVKMNPSGIIKRLNHELQEWDKVPNGFRGSCKGRRPVRRHGQYLADDDYGLLVQDMTPLIALDIELLEFKPKWLTQSRSAPEFAKRCRTCAKRARINAESIKSGEPLMERFCPLDLVSKDDTALYRASRAILAIGDPISPKGYKRLHRMSQWARTSPLLSRLATLQSTLDPVGVFAVDPTDSKFLTAMTLRDCSLYLQVPEKDLSAPIIAKIGDLDLKLPEKSEYWKNVERPLLEEGWYMGTEKQEDKQPLDCNLFPEYWTPKYLKAALRPKRWSDPVTDADV